MNMNKLFELIQDRKGKLSIYKLSFLFWSVGTLIMFLYLSYIHNSFAIVPKECTYFLGTIGAAQLGKSYLTNKAESNNINIAENKT